jgi:acetylornithine deacetylase
VAIAARQFDAPFRARLPEWIRLFQDLVRERSVFEAEHGAVHIVENWIHNCGAVAQRVAHDKARLSELASALPPYSERTDRYSIVTSVRGTGGGRSLVINVPLDIIAEGDAGTWTYPPFEARIVDGRLYGRGAYDDKAGVVIALALVELLSKRQHALRGNVIFQFVLEDEVNGNGTLLCLADGHVGDAALVIDGTRSGNAIDQHVGAMSAHVSLRGKPVSISVSHLGKNAIDLLSELLQDLRSTVFARNASRKAPWTRFPSPFQLVTTSMSGEGTPNTVPEFATAEIQITFPPPDSTASVRALIDERVRAFAVRHDIDVPGIDWQMTFEPVAGGSPLLSTTLRQTCDDLGMQRIDIGPSTGWSDMRRFAEFGMPCILYGPGEGYNPHRADEYYELSDLPRMIEFYYRFIERWCR